MHARVLHPAAPATAERGPVRRAGLLEQAAHELAVAQRGCGVMALVALRLEHLGEVEEALGRPAADTLRREAARRVQAALGPYDLVGQADDHSLVALLPGIGAHDAAATVAPRLAALLAAPFDVAGRPVHIGACSGTAAYPGTGGDAEALLDAALAAAQRGPRR